MKIEKSSSNICFTEKKDTRASKKFEVTSKIVEDILKNISVNEESPEFDLSVTWDKSF